MEALDGNGSLIFVGDRSGRVFRLTAGDQCTQLLELSSRVTALCWDSVRNLLWVGASEALYTWSPTGGVRPAGDRFKVKALRLAGDTLWIGTEQGLWTRRGDTLHQHHLSAELDNARINAVEFLAGNIWIGTHEFGLKRQPAAGGVPVTVEFGSKQVASLFRRGTMLLIGSEKGLYQVNLQDTAWDPKVTIAQLEPLRARPGERVQLEWQIGNYDLRTSRELVRQRIEVRDGLGNVLAKHDVKRGDLQLVLPAPKQPGDYRLRFILTDLAGRETQSDPAKASFEVEGGGLSIPGGMLGWAGGLALVTAVGVLLARGLRPRARVRDKLPIDTTRGSPSAPTLPPPRLDLAQRAGFPPESQPRRLKVFLCHSSGDKPAVRGIYAWLQQIGADPWLDEEKILPGHDWEREITVAVQSSDAVLVCLSQGSVSKAGYVQRELRFALDVAEQQPEGTIFLIPVKLEDCQPPARLHYLHWVNVFGDKGFERLFGALQARATGLGIHLNQEQARRESDLESAGI